ncbi:MAG: hypothetical protein M1813_000911 [Trichoglossum hirsutum]|nr:MAG: hypothetical protein M1813_000911 [Trichoglossum hirsutum]
MLSDHSSAAFHSNAEDEDISDFDDESSTLGKPNIEEEQKEIASDMKEEEDEKGIRFQVNRRRHIKRSKAMLNKTYLDAQPYNIKDSEIEDVVDWKWPSRQRLGTGIVASSLCA